MSDIIPLGADVEPVVSAPLDSVADWTKLFLKLRKQKREIEEQMEEAREVIVLKLEEEGAEFGTLGNKVVLRYRTMETNRFNVSRFRKAEPELAKQYTDRKLENRMEVVEDDE
jgi:hypothetical protein